MSIIKQGIIYTYIVFGNIWRFIEKSTSFPPIIIIPPIKSHTLNVKDSSRILSMILSITATDGTSSRGRLGIFSTVYHEVPLETENHGHGQEKKVAQKDGSGQP